MIDWLVPSVTYGAVVLYLSMFCDTLNTTVLIVLTIIGVLLIFPVMNLFYYQLKSHSRFISYGSKQDISDKSIKSFILDDVGIVLDTSLYFIPVTILVNKYLIDIPIVYEILFILILLTPFSLFNIIRFIKVKRLLN